MSVPTGCGAPYPRLPPPVVQRRTMEAVELIGTRILQSFEASRHEWSAMEAVVHLELLLEAEASCWAELVSPHLMLAAIRSGAVRTERTALTTEG